MKTNKITDASLVKEFKAGSTLAFEELVSRYQAKAYNLAMRFVRSQQDAEEVLQDVFTTLYRKADSFQGKSAFSSWLYRIVVNCAYMKIRKRKQEQAVAVEDLTALPHTPSVTEYRERSDLAAMNGELRESLERAISELPSQYRSVFILRDVDGLSNQEVGEILNLSLPAVKSRLHRSRIMLREVLKETYEEYYDQTAPSYDNDDDSDEVFGQVGNF